MQRIQDGIAITITKEILSERVLKAREEEPELSDALAHYVNDPVRMYLKEIGVVPLLTN